MRRSDVSRFIVIIGLTYMMYSAYYVSVNSPQMKGFMEFLLNMLYVYLFVEIHSNCKKTNTFIRSEIFIVQTTDMP